MALARAATADKVFGGLAPDERRQLAHLLALVGTAETDPDHRR